MVEGSDKRVDGACPKTSKQKIGCKERENEVRQKMTSQSNTERTKTRKRCL